MRVNFIIAKLLVLGFLVTGCSGNRIPLFNYTLNTWWGGVGQTPSAVTIKKGDTLYSISRKYNVPLREVVESNNLRPPYALRIGQRLKLPTAKYHIVSRGDTLYNISKRYNVDMSSLSRTNKLQAPYSLKIGQRLLLPGEVVSKPRATHYIANTPKATSNWQKKQLTQTSSSAKYSSSYSSPVQKRKSKFAWPVQGKIISKYGVIAKGRNNDGINIKAPLGTPVKAADNGTIAYAGNELKGFGNLILIKHSGGWITAYAHNDRISVKKGQKVNKGDKIATVGSTGGVSSPQLHFEVRAGKKAINPLQYLP